MARPSKLNDKQIAECQRRHLEGESIRALAKEHGVSEAALRARISAQTTQIKTVANQIVAAERALAALPVSAQVTAHTFASKLRAMSDNIASAASLGAATSHRLAALANAQVEKVDDADPMKTYEALKGVAALTDMANKAAEPALKLIAANERVRQIAEEGEDKPSAMTLDEFYGGTGTAQS